MYPAFAFDFVDIEPNDFCGPLQKGKKKAPRNNMGFEYQLVKSETFVWADFWKLLAIFMNCFHTL